MRKFLKEARQKTGMTQQQMADALDIGLRYYQFIEAGDRIGDFTSVHQRILRQNESNHLCKEDNQ